MSTWSLKGSKGRKDFAKGGGREEEERTKRSHGRKEEKRVEWEDGYGGKNAHIQT
jgi:hypothetical protein